MGAGWTLALWQPEPTLQPKGTDTLFLVDPLGGRYLVSAALPPDSQLVGWAGAARVALADDNAKGLFAIGLDGSGVLWQQPADTSYQYGFAPAISGDGERVLVEAAVSDVAGGTTEDIRELDVRSGQVLHEFTVNEFASVRYTQPRGLAMVVNGNDRLWRVAPDGTAELTFPTLFSDVGGYDGSYLYTPDGSEVVMGAATGLAVVYNSGAVVGQLPVQDRAPNGPNCQPLEWWAAGVVLASCSTEVASAYWLVPLSGAVPTELGSGAGSGVSGQLWNVGGAAFGLSGACATTWIDELGSDGEFAEVTIPGVTPSEQILGVDAGQLEVIGQIPGCDHGIAGPPSAAALVWFNPSSGTTTFVLGPSVNGGTVLGGLAYPLRQP